MCERYSKYSFVGSANVVGLLLEHAANVNASDINDYTPLHEAARWSDSNEEENESRIKCIELLVAKKADLNALSIRHESPSLIACEYGSSKLVKRLLELGAYILQRNIFDSNCLEVAIEEKNKNVVEYLVDHEQIFQLMRNAQICISGESNHMDYDEKKIVRRFAARI